MHWASTFDVITENSLTIRLRKQALSRLFIACVRSRKSSWGVSTVSNRAYPPAFALLHAHLKKGTGDGDRSWSCSWLRSFHGDSIEDL